MERVSVPLPLLAVLVLLAAVAVLDRALVPGVRWWIRRQTTRVLAEVQTRLRLPVPTFAVTRRRVLLDRLTHDPEVVAAVAAAATAEGAPASVVQARVDRYAREIVPAFNAYLYFRLGTWMASAMTRVIYRVRVAVRDPAALDALPPDATVVFVANHRSNLDYVLLAQVVADRAALSFAVGEWAQVWPLESLIRALGGFFVRRRSNDPLYRTVLARYIAMSCRGGVTQAIFPEGGLSRDGALRPPKLGLLDYVVRGYDPGGREVVFVPAALSYDRVLEDRTLLRDLDPAAERRSAVVAGWTAALFALRNVVLWVTGRWYRFGYACVGFGAPLALGPWLAARDVPSPAALSRDERFGHVAALADELMGRIGAVVPVLPVGLVAEAVLAASEPQSELEIKARVLKRLRGLAASGAVIHLPRSDQDYAVSVGLRMLRLRRLVRERGGLLEPVPEQRPVLGYYAASLAHLATAGSAADAVA